MDELSAALCFQIDTSAGTDSLDGWRLLIPAPDDGGRVRGADGRSWRMSDPRAVVEAFSKPLPVDVNHAEELRAPQGDLAPAYAWIEGIEAREAGIYGLLTFTERGAQAVAAREYRYLSPVFSFDPQSKEIQRVDSAALVNTPNFALALNRAVAAESESDNLAEAKTMDLLAELRTALNLKSDADEPAVVDAVKQQTADLATARNRPADTPALDKFVPRADYDALEQAKNAAETQLAERDRADHTAKVEAAIAAAKAAGKITPATEAYHRANCRTAEGLAAFEQYVTAAPEIGGDAGLAGKTPGQASGALTDDEKAACRAMGVAEETFKERRDADAKAFG
jgi:phage I-like protein